MMEIIYYLLLAVLVLGLIARIAWWTGSIYLGGRTICKLVHKNLPLWWKTAIKLLAYMPEGLSVPGFFFTNINVFLMVKGIMDKDTIESLNLLPGAGFGPNITLTKEELREVSPELEDLFKLDAFAMNATYHGSLNKLNNDLVVRHVFQDAKRVKKAYEKGLKIDPSDKESQENLKIAKALGAKILFSFNSDKLTNEAIEQLNEIAEVLRPKLVPSWIDNVVFEIQGHTDNIGSENYNLQPSQRRAEGVKKYLVEKCGIPERRLELKGYGEDRPIASNETEEGRQMNRRVEIYGIGTRMGLIRVVPEKFETR